MKGPGRWLGGKSGGAGGIWLGGESICVYLPTVSRFISDLSSAVDKPCRDEAYIYACTKTGYTRNWYRS